MTSQGACVNFSLLLAGSCGPGCWMASEEHALSAGERSRVPSASPRTCLESEHAFTQLKKVAHSLTHTTEPSRPAEALPWSRTQTINFSKVCLQSVRAWKKKKKSKHFQIIYECQQRVAANHSPRPLMARDKWEYKSTMGSIINRINAVFREAAFWEEFDWRWN